MADKITMIVGGPDTTTTDDEKAIWSAYGQIHQAAVILLGPGMAFSVLLSRVSRELRREFDIEAAKQTLRDLADTMDEVAKYDL
jgi:hypothetical protein